MPAGLEPDPLEIGGGALSARRLAEAARDSRPVRLHPDALERMRAAQATLVRVAATGARIYGVNTGLGAVADTALPPDDKAVQRRIVLARSVGVGPMATDEQVRAILLARLAGFAVGRSGVSPAVAAAYLAMLNAGIHPVVPLTGSLGEADLAPLAHVGAVLLGAGIARYGNAIVPGAEALARAGLPVPKLGLKDGLALVSSNAASCGLAALVVADAEQALAALAASAALSFEAQRAGVSVLLPEVVALHPVPGQADIARTLLGLLRGGDLVLPGAARLLHDPLSFRCTAPVLGAAVASLRAATAAVELELNTSDDNPAVLDAVLPTANFDTTHLTLAFETLGLALSRVGALTGARIVKLMSAATTGLPRFLTPHAQASSGLAPLQKTVAALVAEIQHDAAPMPSWVLPVADGLEDYATMALPVVRKTAAIVGRLRLLAAAELLTAAQAVDLRAGIRLGDGTARVQAAVRTLVSPLDADRALSDDLLALEAGLCASGFDDIRAALFPVTPPLGPG